LGSEAFGRLRIGIGPLPEGRDAADFVLARFEAAEEAAMEKARTAAGQAVLQVAAGGIGRAMNLYNKKPETPQDQSPAGNGGSGGSA
jgi:PTH1 family peptidyl-tRNA hydrolase